MNFSQLQIPDAFLIIPTRFEDERGFFARTFCRKEFGSLGLREEFVQCSISYNEVAGTLRGLHFQVAPHQEAKLVRCTSGEIFDVLLDLRPESPQFRRWIGLELSAQNRHMVYVPEGVAHGFISLTDNTEVLYQISTFYEPAAARGVRWNDPAFGIQWPRHPRVLSVRDSTYPDFQP